MIIRKPYAFLIKNFKKVHIFLFALAIYIYFKTTQTYSFTREFIRLTSYDRYNEPITKYITSFGILSLLKKRETLEAILSAYSTIFPNITSIYIC